MILEEAHIQKHKVVIKAAPLMVNTISLARMPVKQLFSDPIQIRLGHWKAFTIVVFIFWKISPWGSMSTEIIMAAFEANGVFRKAWH